MITVGLENAIGHLLEDVYLAGASGDPADTVIEERHGELMALIRAEAVNLADRIIGRDKVLRSSINSNDEEYLNPPDKAVFDFQVAQRLELAKYQNVDRGVPTGPETIINNELSPNEE